MKVNNYVLEATNELNEEKAKKVKAILKRKIEEIEIAERVVKQAEKNLKMLQDDYTKFLDKDLDEALDHNKLCSCSDHTSSNYKSIPTYCDHNALISD